jgi:quercetin dioxygenase-like cupin family protein
MRLKSYLAGLLLAAAGATAGAQDAVKSVFQTDVGDLTDQEILILEVNYPPGNDSPVHRHNAHTIVYVLEGAVVMQVEGSEPQTLGAGEVFYETPEDVHTVSRNASDTEAAKILVFFLKGQGAATTEPAD